MESAGKRLRTRRDIGKDIECCLDDLHMTHAELAEILNISDKTVDRMVGGKGPTTKYASSLPRLPVSRNHGLRKILHGKNAGKKRLRLFILKLKMCQIKIRNLWRECWHLWKEYIIFQMKILETS